MGGGAAVLQFPYEDNGDTPTGIFTYSLAHATDGVWVNVATAFDSNSPFYNESSPDPDDLMDASSAGDSQYEADAHRTRLAAVDPDGDFITLVGDAVTKADTAGVFDAVDVTTDMESVHDSESTKVQAAVVDASNLAQTELSSTRSEGFLPDGTDANTAIAALHTAIRGYIDSLLSDAGDAAIVATGDATDSTMITAATNAHDEAIKGKYLRAISDMASGMVDINAVNSSAFVFGLMGIHNEYQQEVSKFAADLEVNQYSTAFNNGLTQYVQAFASTLAKQIDAWVTLEAQKEPDYQMLVSGMLSLYNGTFSAHSRAHTARNAAREQSRDAMVLNAPGQMESFIMQHLSAYSAYVGLQTEVNRIRHAAKYDEFAKNIEMDEKDALWDFELYKYVGNMLASSGGAAIMQPEMSKAQSAIGGALSGAQAGAAIGGPTGGAIGAGVGMIAGLI